MSPSSSTHLRDQLCSEIEAEVRVLADSVRSAAEAATHAEAKAENKYDTRGLESSYLAGAQAERLTELKKTLNVIRQLNLIGTSKQTSVTVTSVVTLECDGIRSVYWLLPCAAGYRLRSDGQDVLTVTTHSPLSRALMGRSTGDVVTVTMGGTDKDYEIMAVDAAR